MPKRRRPRNEALGRAMIELRKGSRAQPHRNRSKYRREDYRHRRQRGEDDS